MIDNDEQLTALGILAGTQPLASDRGLLMSPDLYFLEADFARNVTVSGNYLSTPFGDTLHSLAYNFIIY